MLGLGPWLSFYVEIIAIIILCWWELSFCVDGNSAIFILYLFMVIFINHVILCGLIGVIIFCFGNVAIMILFWEIFSLSFYIFGKYCHIIMFLGNITIIILCFYCDHYKSCYLMSKDDNYHLVFLGILLL